MRNRLTNGKGSWEKVEGKTASDRAILGTIWLAPPGPIRDALSTLLGVTMALRARITDLEDAMLAARNRKSGDQRSTPALDEAKDFLRDLLSDGPMPATDVHAERKSAGIALGTVRRAKKDLGIEW